MRCGACTRLRSWLDQWGMCRACIDTLNDEHGALGGLPIKRRKK